MTVEDEGLILDIRSAISAIEAAQDLVVLGETAQAAKLAEVTEIAIRRMGKVDGRRRALRNWFEKAAEQYREFFADLDYGDVQSDTLDFARNAQVCLYRCSSILTGKGVT